MSLPITRRTLLAAATAAVLATAITPFAPSCADSLARVDVYDRSAGEELPVYRHHGRRYVVGQPGNEYAIRIRNCSGRRLSGLLCLAIAGGAVMPLAMGAVGDAFGSVTAAMAVPFVSCLYILFLGVRAAREASA